MANNLNFGYVKDCEDSPSVVKEIPFSFSWENLTLWVNEKRGNFWSTKQTKRYILENECGRVQSNSFVAIMGPSGVGKTSFLAALAGKNEDMTGTISINKKVIPKAHTKNISGYIFQDDLAVDSLTVEEHLIFMNSLKSYNNDKTDISKVITELNLEACRHSQIKNLSGGEKKRLSLAVELLNDPLVLFCDEPTTGLDSYSAITIIQKLQSRTKQGKLVVLTIHQPSSHIFDYFDQLLLMSHGKIFFHGNKSEVSLHFKSLGLICPLNYNAADFYINCMSKPWELKAFPTIKNQLFEEEVDCNYSINSKLKNGCCRELYWLLWRDAIDTKNKFGYHAFQFGLLMITASLLALFYTFVDTEHESAVQNIRGIMFFFSSELIFTHTYNVINTFPEEYHIILREKELYSNTAYFLAKLLSIVPRNIIQPLAFISINFIFIDFLSGFDMFCQMFGVLFAACLSGSILGLCISAVFSSLEYMDLFIAPFELITMLAAGILIKLDTVVYFGWIKYLSPFYYTYESLSVIYWSRIEEIECSNTSQVCYSSGKEVLEELGFVTDTVDIFWNMFYITVLSGVIAVIAFSTISYKRKMCTSY